MYNLGTVFRFEVIRTLKKKSFWIMALSFPIIIAAVFAIIFFSNQATNAASKEAKNQKFSMLVTDESNTISPAIIQAFGAHTTSDKQAAINKVKKGKLDAYVFYPHSLNTQPVEVYAKDVGLFDNGRYEAVTKILLQQSATQKVSPQVAAILKDQVSVRATTYKNGQEFNGFQELIAPGIFLVLFYILIAMFGNQMLTSTTEEKENRVIEMLLTTIQARTLIIGKILSLIVLALIQIAVILIPVIIAYVFFRDNLSIPDIDLATIPLDPVRILVGAIIFALSFLLFMGVLVAIGAAAPTAKEAGGFFGVVMVLIFGPLYAFSLFISSPESPIVTFLSFFPLTAPIPLMLRNAIGNLSTFDAIIGIVILAISATIALMLAIRFFRYGALEYSKRLSLKTVFKRS